MNWFTGTDRIPRGPSAWVAAVAGGPVRRRVAYWALLLPKLALLEAQWKEQDDRQLRKASLSLRYRAKSGEPLRRLLPEAYSLVREAARRTIDMRHFDVQMIGGIALFRGSIAEMETGEGKTLTATLPVYLRALPGKGAQLATVNDYLARRDAEWMGPIYRLLGMTVGVIQTGMSPAQRRAAYRCDVTYGTAKEFGFDFLRDRLLLRRLGGGPSWNGNAARASSEEPLQREPYFIVVDEADSILIDEARTPLIISAMANDAKRREVACYKWAAESIRHFVEDEHYTYDHKKRKVELAGAGRQLVRTLPKPPALNPVGLVNLYQYMERAIKVEREFHLDRQYVVRDGEVVIVDEFTGRLSEGRKWREGIHQAVEAKENIEATVETGQAARVTVQDFFLRFDHLAGMTGTARTSAREFQKIYRLRVVPIPTNRPIRRYRLTERVFGHSDAKWAAIVEEIRDLHDRGRPVLVGTRSIDKSEVLSGLLTEAGIAHQVLNANRIAEEAEIVAEAGQPGKVTVATNMAGRGTDIKLGPGVAELGGLHVICTERHDAARIDRQLAGRCGRQGDPGTWRQYLALDDEILKWGLGPKKAARLAAHGAGATRSFGSYRRLFRLAQRRVEGRHYRGRRMLMHHEKERKKMQIEMGQDPYLDTLE